MLPSLVRLTALLLVSGCVCAGLASVAPARPAHAIDTPALVAASLSPYDAASAAEPFHVRAQSVATPSPTSAPTPAPAPVAVVPRSLATVRPVPVPAIDAQEIVIFNLDTGRFLWQSNARAGWAPASLTKIFTAMVAVDLMGLNATLTVPASISQLPADSTLMGLTPGERVTVRELMYGVFLNSGNDAAETLASAVTTRAAFVADMNAKAARLGLRTTHFENPTGLDAAGHYSSAYDLAIAGAYLESHYGALVSIAATPSITLPATATHKAFSLVSLDKLLWTYPGTYGLKTGWTDAALGCLITTSNRGGHRLLAVLLGAPAGTAYAQMPKVLDYGFELIGVLPRPASP
ncbi:MAG TPA: serine hydrolase [Candidatus Dormibacteraeota bacterium]|nr:serine hydrolase [Candidatus Dormibacteraeota bacterium]